MAMASVKESPARWRWAGSWGSRGRSRLDRKGEAWASTDLWHLGREGELGRRILNQKSRGLKKGGNN